MATPTKRAGIGCWALVIVSAVALGAGLVALGRFRAQATVRFPTIVGQNCGAVRFARITQSDDPDHAALCLWRAYAASTTSASCHAATLVFIVQLIDTGETHVITLQSSGGRCALTDTMRFSGVRGDLPIHSYACASLRQQFGGLLLSGCGGERNIYVPPPADEQTSTLCGTITNRNHTVSAPSGAASSSGAMPVASIEDCFWQAYASCAYPASLTYESDAPDSAMNPTGARSYTLTLDAYPFGGCELWYVETLDHQSQSQSVVRCHALARQPDGGLITQGCDEGLTLAIPPATPPNR